MTKSEAIEYLGEGHSLWSIECAKEVCKSFNLELPDRLIIRWKNQKEANSNNDPKGIWLTKPNDSGEGVESIKLSNWIIDKLGLSVMLFHGRGTQARMNAQAIRSAFNL